MPSVCPHLTTVWRRKPRNFMWPVIKQIHSFGFGIYYLCTESFNWPICLWVPTPLHNTSYNTQLSIFTAWIVNAVRINSQRIKWQSKSGTRVYLVVYITMPQHQSNMFPVLPLLSLLSLEMHTCMHHCSTAITTVSFGWQATDIGRVSVGLANFWVK